MDRQQQKEVGLVVFEIIFSAALFWYIGYSLMHNAFGLAPIVLTLLGIVWVAITAFTLAVIKTHASAGLVVGLLPLSVIVVGKAGVASLAAALILALALTIAFTKIRLEARTRIKYNTFHIFFSGTRMLTLAIIVVTAGLAAPAVTNQIESKNIIIPEETVVLIVKPFEGVIGQFVPGYQAEATVDEFIESQLQEQLKQLPPGTQLPEDQVAQVREQLGRQFKQSVEGQQRLSSLITDIVNQRINEIVETSPLAASVALLLALVLVVRLVIPLIAWIPLLLISGLVYTTQQQGFSYITKLDVVAERLNI